MSHSDAFQNFVEDNSVGAVGHVPKDGLEAEIFEVVSGYVNHVNGLRNQKGSVLNIECGFVKNYDFNGAAGVNQGLHCCLLDVNLVGAMTDLAMTALSIPDVLTDVGKPELEDVSRVTRRNWPMGYALAVAPGVDDREPFERLTRPLDVTRRLCAVYLLQVAVDLLWRHEVAHVLLGHVDFALDSYSLRALNERSMGGKQFEVLPMEVEADKHALLSCLDSASQGAVYFPRAGLELTTHQRYRCTILAASLVLWFWSYLEKHDRRNDPSYKPSETHPPSVLRLIQILTGIWEYFVRMNRDADGFIYVMDRIHDDLQAISQAHPRFEILNPKKLYAPEMTDAATKTHKFIAQQRDFQKKHLEPYRFFTPQA